MYADEPEEYLLLVNHYNPVNTMITSFNFNNHYKRILDFIQKNIDDYAYVARFEYGDEVIIHGMDNERYYPKGDRILIDAKTPKLFNKLYAKLQRKFPKHTFYQDGLLWLILPT